MSSQTPKLKIQKAKSVLLMIAMFSIVMLFAGLTSAYIVSKGALGVKWDIIELPSMFYISTLIILLSSVTGYWAVYSCKKNDFQIISRTLLLTILCGILFLVFQFLGWNELVKANKFLSGNNVASSYLYVFTLTHLLHLIGGLISLIIIYFNSLKKKYNLQNFHGLKLGVTFWHFLCALWVYLYLFLLIIN